MKAKKFPVTNIGSVSLLIVFIVLCLVTFATLSLSSAASDYTYSKDTADHNTEYYEACNQASLTLQRIDTILSTAYEQNPGGYYTEAENALKNEGNIKTDFASSTPSIAFETPVNDSKALQVKLTLNSPADLSSGYYRISIWQEASSIEWDGNETLNLIQ